MEQLFILDSKIIVEIIESFIMSKSRVKEMLKKIVKGKFLRIVKEIDFAMIRIDGPGNRCCS